MPKDTDGPVFRAPWEAMAFAIVVKLSEQGNFTWAEWVELFSAQIKHAESHHSFDPELDYGNEYYRIWLAALEKMIVSKNLVQSQEVNRRHQYLIDNPVPHDHITRREPIRVI
jgi:nitrile hydratase accessory protein